MRWLLLVLVACGGEKKPAKRDAAVRVVVDAVVVDAAVDAADIGPPQQGEIVVPAGGGVAAFFLDKTEATIGDYKQCIAAKACSATSRVAEKTGDASWAMGGLTFYQARAYCAWRGKRLPTPAEWKRAAYGDDARPFPWGSEPITCERAYHNGCGEDHPVAPGRPAGASAFGALDMLGNVDEWTDPGALVFANACVEKPRVRVPVFGGEYYDKPDSPLFLRDNTIADTPMWFENPDLGVRCARGGSASAPPLFASMWTLVPTDDPIREVTRRCKAGEQVSMIQGDLVGAKGWAIITPGGTTAAPKLTRVVGDATCDEVDELTKLTITSGKQKWKLDIPSDIGFYEVWLPPGWATFDIACRPRPSKGECSFAMVKADAARFLVPDAPASGVEGPGLEADGGMVCD